MDNVIILTESSDFLNGVVQIIVSNFSPFMNNNLYLIGMLVVFLCVMAKAIIDIFFED